MHHFFSIIAITFLTIKKYIDKNEKSQLKFLLNNFDYIKKLNNRRILENSNEHDNLDSNNFLNYSNLTIDYSFENNFINISEMAFKYDREGIYLSFTKTIFFIKFNRVFIYRISCLYS